MRKRFYLILWVCTALTAVLAILYTYLENSILQTLLITVGTTAYHFWMRLAIGYAVERFFPTSVDPNGFWFRERCWEKRCYKRLRVRKWAKRVPTFKPEQFDVRTRTTEELIWQTCLSETVHTWIVFGGFSTLLFCFFFDDPLGNLAPFLITAILAGAFDLQFVILQRYNRPKLLRLTERRARRSAEKTEIEKR